MVYFDLETNGFYKEGVENSARITQIAAEAIVGGTKYVFSEVCNPEAPISQRVLDLTHLTKQKLLRARSFRVVLPSFFDFLRDIARDHSCSIILVAYNNFNFDAQVLARNCRSIGINFIECCRRASVTGFADALVWCKECVLPNSLKKNARGKPSFKLMDVYSSMFNSVFENAHDATADTAALRRICTDGPCVSKSFVEYVQTETRSPMNILQVVTQFKEKPKRILYSSFDLARFLVQTHFPLEISCAPDA
jgi:DNA polymerase III epsilon subunit-like protein